MTDGPLFSVVMATFNRGRHILPSITSVLGQTLTDFELLVVGDGCTDDTGKAVCSCLDPRVSWTNLPVNGGSQSFANNAGIAAARGRYIAYLGHDDLWSADHLERLAHLFRDDDELDVAVSGALLHSPPGVGMPGVTGIFDESGAALRHFFPPSSFAHRRDLTDRIGPWGNPFELRKPVDADLLYRAATANMRFRSTGRITVHKFTAAQRYLSYLTVVSDEQEAMLKRMGEPEFDTFVEQEVETAKRVGGFMVLTNGPDREDRAPGEEAASIAARKGSRRIPLVELDGVHRIEQRAGPHAYDWQTTPRRGILWSSRNPNPRVLLPVAHDGVAAVLMTIAHAEQTALKSLAVDGTIAPSLVGPAYQVGKHWRADVFFEIGVRTDRATAVQLHLEGAQHRQGDVRGLGIGDILVARSAGELAIKLAADNAMLSKKAERPKNRPDAAQVAPALVKTDEKEGPRFGRGPLKLIRRGLTRLRRVWFRQ